MGWIGHHHPLVPCLRSTASFYDLWGNSPRRSSSCLRIGRTDCRLRPAQSSGSRFRGQSALAKLRIENLAVGPDGVIVLGCATTRPSAWWRPALSGGVSLSCADRGRTATAEADIPTITPPGAVGSAGGATGACGAEAQSVSHARAALAPSRSRAWLVGKVVGKVVAVLAVLPGRWGGRWTVRHVVDSPRFQVKQIDIAATQHVRREELVALPGHARRPPAQHRHRRGSARLHAPWVAAQVKPICRRFCTSKSSSGARRRPLR